MPIDLSPFTSLPAWQGRRSAASYEAQARAVARDFLSLSEGLSTLQDKITAVIARWTTQGLSADTINKRLVVMKQMLDAYGNNEPLALTFQTIKRNKRKWWLKPEEEDAHWQRMARFDAGPDRDWADFVRWTTRTGMRIEESLRTTFHDFQWTQGAEAILVNGTKTENSQRVLALGATELEIARRRLCVATVGGVLTAVSWEGSRHALFDFSYEFVLARFQAMRDTLNVPADLMHTCTPKGLRRTAVRFWVIAGMPGPIIQQRLGHADFKTTQGYLDTVGDYTVEQQRQWL